MLFDSLDAAEHRFQSISKSLHLERLRFFFHVVMPASAPRLWDSGRIAFGWAWTYLIVGEIFVADVGIGSAILRAQRFADTNTIYFDILIIGILEFCFDLIFRLVGRAAFWWGKTP